MEINIPDVPTIPETTGLKRCPKNPIRTKRNKGIRTIVTVYVKFII